MNALTPLAVQNLDLLRRLRQGDVGAKDTIAAELGRDPANFRKTIKRLTDEGLIAWPNLTEAGERVIAAADFVDLTDPANPVRPISTLPTNFVVGEIVTNTPPAVRVWIHADFVANPDQPRKTFDPLAIEERAASIKEVGQLQNILARPNPALAAEPDAPALQIVAGESRWRSMGLLIARGDWPADHPVNVDVRDLTDEQVDRLALIENVQRANLTFLEEANAYARMQRVHGWSANQIATEVAKEGRVVQLRLRLLRLTPAEQQKLEDGEITYSQAQKILDARPKPLDLTPAQRLIVAEIVAAATPEGADATHWRNAETDRDTAAAAIAQAGLDKALTITGPKYATGIFEVGFGNDWSFFERFKTEHPDLIKGDTRAAALLAIRASAAGADAAEAADTDGRQLTPWLNGPFALTEEGQAVVAAHEQSQRDSATAETTRAAEAQVRADRLANAQALTDALLTRFSGTYGEGRSGPVVDVNATFDALEASLPWTYQRSEYGVGELIDRDGKTVPLQWGATTPALLQLIMGAVNGVGGLGPVIASVQPAADDDAVEDLEDPRTLGEFEEEDEVDEAPDDLETRIADAVQTSGLPEHVVRKSFEETAPVTLVAYPPTAREILGRPWEPAMPEHARFALLERPADPFCKPKVYPTADDLGRAIHVRRKTRPILLLDAALKVQGETTARRGVSVWAINPGDDVAGDYLGWVFIGGLQRRELMDLLDRLDKTPPTDEAHAQAA